MAAGAVQAAPPKPATGNWPEISSDADMERHLPVLSNWGRWSASDELGALNLITPALRKAAAKEIRSGRAVTLGRRTNIAEDAERGAHEVDKRTFGSRDYTAYVFHGFEMTHLDALGHVFANPEQLYGGASTDEVTPAGLNRLGVDAIARNGVAGRGVLIDIAAHYGRALEPGETIEPETLDAAVEKQGADIRPGDILFVRTGLGRNNTRAGRAGLGHRCLFWLKENDIALLSGDGDSDAAPLEGFERWASPMHTVAIPYLGLPLIDNADLEDLASACAEEKRWSFFCTVNPLKLAGATGSAVNPVAIL